MKCWSRAISQHPPTCATRETLHDAPTEFHNISLSAKGTKTRENATGGFSLSLSLSLFSFLIQSAVVAHARQTASQSSRKGATDRITHADIHARAHRGRRGSPSLSPQVLARHPLRPPHRFSVTRARHVRIILEFSLNMCSTSARQKHATACARHLSQMDVQKDEQLAEKDWMRRDIFFFPSFSFDTPCLNSLN